MTNQWHNPNIVRKPYHRYNPSLRQKVSSTYRRWFLVVAFLSFIVGIVLIGLSSAIKELTSDIRNELFHIWVGIPLIIFGIVPIVCFIFRKKWMVIIFLVLSFIMMLIALSGTMAAGVYYFKDGWRYARYSLDNGYCSVANNVCGCIDIEPALIPAKFAKCDDMETVVDLIIAEMFFSACATIISIMAMYMSFMSLCCAPWMYMEWYDPGYDPDFPNKAPYDPEPKVLGVTNRSFRENYYN